MATKVADNPGDDNSKIAFIFSCPGRLEEKNNIVCYGATGTNLEKLLNILTSIDPETFFSSNRYDYTIVNSCDTVYPNNDNKDKTEPDYSEIDDDNNLDRLYKALKNKECAVCFGDRAKHAIESLKKNYPDFNIESVGSNHLSPSNLNRKYHSDQNTPQDRNIDRIIEASESIMDFYRNRNKDNK